MVAVPLGEARDSSRSMSPVSNAPTNGSWGLARRVIRGVVGVVFDPPVLCQSWASGSVSNCSVVSSSSRKRPLNDSHQPFCHGDPGSMNAVSVPPNRHRSRIALAVSSGPLSMRRFAGRRPAWKMILSSRIVVSSAVKDRAAVVVRASRVNSSMMLAKRICRPSAVTSTWESIAHI